MHGQRANIIIACAVFGALIAGGAALAAARGLSLGTAFSAGTALAARAFHGTFGIDAAGGDGVARGGDLGEVMVFGGDPGAEATSVSAVIPEVSIARAAPVIDRSPHSASDDHISSMDIPRAPSSSVLSFSPTPSRSLSSSSIPSSSSSSSSSFSSSSPMSLACTFPSLILSSSFSRTVIMNEIAWMGSPSSSLPDGAHPASAEWIELKNISARTIALSGWTFMDVSGKIAMRFPDDARIPAGGMLLLVRGSTTFPYARASQIPYSGDLRNAGDDLAIMDASCGISDLVAASEGWPAGENDAKRTMERDVGGEGWHTSTSPGGTPGGENSVPPPSHYRLTVSFQGVSGGSVVSTPEGLACTTTGCAGTFPAGGKVTLRAAPAAGGVFDGWSGACSGHGSCIFVLQGDTAVLASFHIPLPDPEPAPSIGTASSGNPEDTTSSSTPASASTSISISPTSSLGSVSGAPLLIAAVQIAGVSSTNDYVRIYNPGLAAVDLRGWKLKKRSQTGADYSLRTFPAGAAIAAGHYFTWANTEGEFAAVLGADASSTETISANNSVALFDPDGVLIDAVAWGTGAAPFGEGNPFSENPPAGRALVRRMDGGIMRDTGDNAGDFELH